MWERKIYQLIFNNRMNYEPWIETAKDFEDLKLSLRERGYVNLPNGPNLMLDLDAYSKAPEPEIKEFSRVKTMLRRKKS